MVLQLNKLEFPSPKNALCQIWLKLGQWFWRRRFLNFVNIFSLFRYYLPLERGGGFHLNKFESPSPKDALCQVWLKLAQWFWRRRFLNFFKLLGPIDRKFHGHGENDGFVLYEHIIKQFSSFCKHKNIGDLKKKLSNKITCKQ